MATNGPRFFADVADAGGQGRPGAKWRWLTRISLTGVESAATLVQGELRLGGSVLRTVGQEAGFATADALVAMLVLAISITLSFQAVAIGRRLSDRARELRQANLLLGELLSGPQPAVHDDQGSSGRFQWRLRSRTVGLMVDPDAPRLCEREALVRPDRGRRTYHDKLQLLCPTEGRDAP